MSDKQTVTASFRLERSTPGALRFREVNEKGEFFAMPNSPGCKMGTFYIRRSELGGSARDFSKATATIVLE